MGIVKEQSSCHKTKQPAGREGRATPEFAHLVDSETTACNSGRLRLSTFLNVGNSSKGSAGDLDKSLNYFSGVTVGTGIPH